MSSIGMSVPSTRLHHLYTIYVEHETIQWLDQAAQAESRLESFAVFARPPEEEQVIEAFCVFHLANSNLACPPA